MLPSKMTLLLSSNRFLHLLVVIDIYCAFVTSKDLGIIEFYRITVTSRILPALVKPSLFLSLSLWTA
jgi:hypothetical protein